MTYEDLEVGMPVEYEDFWYSGILSWRAGIIGEVIYGGVPIKVVLFDGGKEGRNIREHRMNRVRRIVKVETL